MCVRLNPHFAPNRLNRRLPTVKLQAYASYVVFFPSFVAGPIDRLERFTGDFCRAVSLDRSAGRRRTLQAQDGAGVWTVKKFAIA